MTYHRKKIKNEPVIELVFANEEEYSTFFEMLDDFGDDVSSCGEDIKSFAEKFRYKRTLGDGTVTTIAYIESISTVAVMLCLGLMFDHFAQKYSEPFKFSEDDDFEGSVIYAE